MTGTNNRLEKLIIAFSVAVIMIACMMVLSCSTVWADSQDPAAEENAAVTTETDVSPESAPAQAASAQAEEAPAAPVEAAPVQAEEASAAPEN